jgi:uncharacterized peroxidase-related enzyme
VAHIHLDDELPGILGPFAFSPATAKPLRALAEVLLRGPSSLSPAEREMIATFVSSRNGCDFCRLSHGAAAAAYLAGNDSLIEQLTRDYRTAELSAKMKTLLSIAGKVQVDGKRVTAEDIQDARQQGATDQEIHDTVLIAAAFCMYNRYVDGLGTWQPRDPEMYREMGQRMASQGYVRNEQ